MLHPAVSHVNFVFCYSLVLSIYSIQRSDTFNGLCVLRKSIAKVDTSTTFEDSFHLVTKDEFTTPTMDDLNQAVRDDGSCPSGKSFLERTLVANEGNNLVELTNDGNVNLISLEKCEAYCRSMDNCQSFARCLWTTLAPFTGCWMKDKQITEGQAMTTNHLYHRECKTHYLPASAGDGCKSVSGKCRKCNENGYNCDTAKTNEQNCQDWCRTFPGCSGVFLEKDGTCCPGLYHEIVLVLFLLYIIFK